MKKFLFAGIAAAALVSAPAFAADMPVKASPPAVAPLFNWTGCYIGGNAGYGWSREKVVDALGGAEVNNITARGAVAGGQLGCDVQSGAWVFGARGMWDWADLKKTDAENLNPAFIDHLSIRSFARVTGRVGYAIQPDSLLYVDGGWAWMKTHFFLENPIGGSASFHNDGWTVGVGWEKMIGRNWSFFIEYEYADLGRKLNVATPPGAALTSFKQNLNVVLIGLNYRFGGDPWGKSPVVAKY